MVPWGKGAGGGAPGRKLRMMALFFRPRIRAPDVSGLMGTKGVLLFFLGGGGARATTCREGKEVEVVEVGADADADAEGAAESVWVAGSSDETEWWRGVARGDAIGEERCGRWRCGARGPC